MQKQFKYIYNNEEVSREDFEKLAGDSFKWFDGDSVVSVPFSSFDSSFTGNFKSRRQINDHLDSVLNVYQNKVTEDIINKPKCSPQCFCDGSCKKPQQKNINSTRHKSQAGETHIFKTNVEQREKLELLRQYLLNQPSVQNDVEKVTKVFLSETEEELKRMISAEKIKTEEKDDVITSSNRGEKETMEHLQGVKETEGKLNYELDWEFIQQMAERMSQNKGKYKPYNWKRPMEIEKLKQSLFRHVVEVMKGNYSDDGREFGHFESIALNSMMINYQLKVK